MPRSSNSNSRVWTPKELSKVPVGELKSIRVSVKRSNVASAGPSTDLIRGIDDPKAITQLVHCKRGALRCAMFDRDDIIVNPEEQFVSVDTRLESSRSRNASRSASRSSRSPEYNRRDDRRDSRSKEKDRDKARSRSERTPVRDGLRRRSRSPSIEDRWKCRSSSREYRRRSRSKSKSASRERLDRPSCSTRRSPSPRPTRKIGAPLTSRSPVIRKRSSSPQRRTSRERSERRRSRSRSRTPRRPEAKYRDRREERRSRSPLYHSSRRRGSRSRSPPSGGKGGRRSSSRERRRMRSRSPRDRRRPRSRSRSPRRNGPRGPQHHLDSATVAGHKMDPYAAMATAMASYYEHMPPELWMNPAAAAAAAAMRFPGAGGPVPNRFFGVGAGPFFPPRGGPPFYPRYPLPNYNTPYRPRQPVRPIKPDASATLPNAPPNATSTPLSESTTTGESGDGVREVSKKSTNGDDREGTNSDSHEKS